MTEDKSRAARWCGTCDEYRLVVVSQVDGKFIGKCLFCDRVLVKSKKNPVEKPR